MRDRTEADNVKALALSGDRVARKQKPSYLGFDKESYPWKPDIDYRLEPGKYRVGKGEQGVLICQPYKSELVPLWKFKTPQVAKISSQALYKKFIEFMRNDDFVGADLARKYLQMGFTRARDMQTIRVDANMTRSMTTLKIKKVREIE